MKKIIRIILLAIILTILSVVGYFIYQLIIVPEIVRLPVPNFSYPPQSVTYKYYIWNNGLTMRTTFGVHNYKLQQVSAEIEKDMEAIKTSGFDGIKLSYNFKADNYFSNRIALKASNQGLYTVGLLQGHQAKPKNRAFSREEMAEWLNFVKEEVESNKNIIYFWEIWNEPVVDMFAYGTPEEYVDLLKQTYPIIKKANPNAKIISNLDAHDSRSMEFSEKAMEMGAGNYFDVLSVHPYAANPYIREDVILSSISGEISLAAKYGNRWPIIIGEIGQPTSEVSEAEQARLAKFVYDQAQKNKMPVTWYYWSDERIPKDGESVGGGSNWGLIRSDGTQRPILGVIKEFMQ